MEDADVGWRQDEAGEDGLTDSILRYALRHAEPSDGAYIVDTWVGSATKLPITSLYGARPAYHLTWRARKLLAKHGARIACDPEAPTVILGWACVAARSSEHDPVVLWAYVREDFRGVGLAKALLHDRLESSDPTVAAFQLYVQDDETKRSRPRTLPPGWRYSHFGIEWALTD